jgi:hypothetical protein
MKTFILPLMFLALFASAVVLRVETSKAAPAHEPAVDPVIATAPLPGHAGKVLERACRDCHSNQTSWPWYSNVPPASWMIQRDVDLGRRMFDFTDWSSGRATPTKDQMSLICVAVSAGSMPPLPYRRLHPQAKLTPGDVDALCKLADSPDAR